MDIKFKIYLTSVILIIFGCGISYIFYGNSNINDRLVQNEKIIDSLNKKVLIYKQKNDSLQIVAFTLDQIIKNQEVKVVTVKEKFIVYKTPEIKNSSDAFKFINNFIVE